MDANRFFLENGGSELIAAYGIDKPPSLGVLFGTRLPGWPKEDGVVPKTTVAAPMGQVAVLIVVPGSLVLHSSIAPPLTVPEGVTVERPLFGKQPIQRGIALLGKARPMLFLTVAASYPRDVANAGVTLDPNTVCITGKLNLSIDAYRIETIGTVSRDLSMDVPTLLALAKLFEISLIDPMRPLTGLNTIKAMRKALGIKGGAKGDVEDDAPRLRDAWSRIADLPRSTDPSWIAAAELHKEGN